MPTREELVERKVKLSLLMKLKMEVWNSLYNHFESFMNNSTIISIVGDSNEYRQIRAQLYEVKEVLDYTAARVADDAFTWKAFLLVDEDLKTRMNLINILFTRLRIIED